LLIKLRGIEEGEHHYSAEESAEYIGLDTVQFPTPVKIHVMVDRRGTNCYMDIQLSAEYSLLYTEDPAFQDLENDEDMRFIPSDTGEISLDDDIRQILLLQIPIKVLCSEDCRGICPHCGANLNTESCNCKNEHIDSRWEKLKYINVK